MSRAIRIIKKYFFFIEMLLASLIIWQFYQDRALVRESKKIVSLEHLSTELKYIKNNFDEYVKSVNNENVDLSEKYFRNALDSLNVIGYGINQEIYAIETINTVFYGKSSYPNLYKAYKNYIGKLRKEDDDTNLYKKFEKAVEKLID